MPPKRQKREEHWDCLALKHAIFQNMTRTQKVKKITQIKKRKQKKQRKRREKQ